MAYMTDLLMHMIETGEKVHAVPVNGGWLEIDTAHDLQVARETVRNGTAKQFRDRTAR
jgi:NDP-sugar pyrophosphorylase family protein